MNFSLVNLNEYLSKSTHLIAGCFLDILFLSSLFTNSGKNTQMIIIVINWFKSE